MAPQIAPRSLTWVCGIVPSKLGSWERLCILVAQHAFDAHVPMHVVFEGSPSPVVSGALQDAGATWSVVDDVSSLRWPAARRLLRHLNARSPGMLHYHYCDATSLLFPFLSSLGWKQVFTYHISGAPAPAGHLAGVLRRMRALGTASWLDGITAVSVSSRRKLVADYRVREELVKVVYNGVMLSESPRPAGARPTSVVGPSLVVVGSLIHEKGMDVAIRAMAHIRELFPAARLSIIGVGGQETALRQLAEDIGVAAAIDWLGQRDDVPDLLAKHDLAIVPSRWTEAFGLSLAEAMAAGLPVVASAVGGIPEIIENGVSGVLVEPDDPIALASVVCGILQDPRCSQRLGDAARQRVREKFTLDRCATDYWHLYQDIDTNFDPSN